MNIKQKTISVTQKKVTPPPVQERRLDINNLTPREASALAAAVFHVLRADFSLVDEFRSDLKDLLGRFQGAGVPDYTATTIAGVYNNPRLGMPKGTVFTRYLDLEHATRQVPRFPRYARQLSAGLNDVLAGDEDEN